MTLERSFGRLGLTPTLSITRMPYVVLSRRAYPLPCVSTILKHTMPRSEPGLLVMCFNMVPRVRLELTHLSTLEPKSSAATNYATEAKLL